MLSEISQTEKEKYCIISPIRGILKKGKSNSEKQRVESWLPGVGVGGRSGEMLVKGYKLSVIR